MSAKVHIKKPGGQIVVFNKRLVFTRYSAGTE